jgi:ribosome-associated protein
VIPAMPVAGLGWAVEAALDKKASALAVLDLRELASFTDFFLLCTGWSVPQVQAIADEIEQRLGERGLVAAHREGYDTAEWVLLDYRDFVVHIFSERARLYYDLERLWRAARRIHVPESGAAPEAALR